MSLNQDSREPVELLAEEFLARRRAGERVTAQDYADAHPLLAGAILDLFPTMLALEKLGDDDADSAAPATAFQHPEQLGDLRLLREIGRGGMGIVYEAEQQSLGRRVAVKILPERSLFDSKRLERFRREARTAGSLQHPNIVPIYGVGEQDGLHYLSMQLIEGAGLDVLVTRVGSQAASGSMAGGPAASDPRTNGGDPFADSLAQALLADDFTTTASVDLSSPTLADSTLKIGGSSGTQTASSTNDAPTIDLSDALSQSANDSASLAFDIGQSQSDVSVAAQRTAQRAVGDDYYRSVAKVGIQAAEALAYAHARGTLHRDIKPANLLLDRRGNVWITDFGLAKAMDSLAGDGNSVSRTGELVGTLRYMAPEQLGGDAGPQSDLYSLGLTLYELVAWRPAFDATAPSELIRKITSEGPPPPRKHNSQLPVDLETILLKAIARDPADRYQTGDDLAADLRRFMEGIPVAAQRTGMVQHAVRWTRHNPAIAGLTAAVILLSGATLLAMAGYFGGVSTEPAPAADTSDASTGEQASSPQNNDRPAPPPRGFDRPRGPRFGPPPDGRRGSPPPGEFRGRPPRGQFVPGGRRPPLPPPAGVDPEDWALLQDDPPPPPRDPPDFRRNQRGRGRGLGPPRDNRPDDLPPPSRP